MWNKEPSLLSMMLSLCLSPIPKTHVATQYPAHDLVKLSTAFLYSSSVGLQSLSQLAMGSSLKLAATPPAPFMIPLVVSAFITTSIIPISFPVETQSYTFMHRSRWFLFHSLSMIRIICRVSMSCLRSSPALKMIYTGLPTGSALLITSHNGSFLLSMYLHFSTLRLPQTTRGLSGSEKEEGKMTSCSLLLRTLSLSSAPLTSLMSSATETKAC
mmetsp:Transcript_4008/g.14059  ORF Transcript_4008/g.14059 Transcript_4008/m.14059 type:complete len:214 (+) Transcript_4008:445-1086(+)